MCQIFLNTQQHADFPTRLQKVVQHFVGTSPRSRMTVSVLRIRVQADCVGAVFREVALWAFTRAEHGFGVYLCYTGL